MKTRSMAGEGLLGCDEMHYVRNLPTSGRKGFFNLKSRRGNTLHNSGFHMYKDLWALGWPLFLRTRSVTSALHTALKTSCTSRPFLENPPSVLEYRRCLQSRVCNGTLAFMFVANYLVVFNTTNIRIHSFSLLFVFHCCSALTTHSKSHISIIYT